MGLSASVEFGTSQAWERVQPEGFLHGMSRKIENSPVWKRL